MWFRGFFRKRMCRDSVSEGKINFLDDKKIENRP